VPQHKYVGIEDIELTTLGFTACLDKIDTLALGVNCIPTRGNLFLPVRLHVWAEGRGTVMRADSAARAELQGAPKQKLLRLKNIQKCHWVKHREMLICCLDVSPDM
jgi:hypothetical protein